MYIHVTNHMFAEAFVSAGRGSQFSREALDLIFDFIEEYEEEGRQTHLDVIAVCCDFTEATPQAIAEEHILDVITAGSVRDMLEKKTVVLGETSHGTIVYQNF
jgi:hypothetical protein